MNTNTKCKQWRMPFFDLSLCFLLVIFAGDMVYSAQSRLDQPAQRISGLFRQQFYDTGDFFPEFAVGASEEDMNIYNFAYYGLYSPAFLLSYLLPL